MQMSISQLRRHIQEDRSAAGELRASLANRGPAA